MNRNFISLVAAASVAISAFCVQTPAIADQPKMDRAIELLQEAKKSDKPIPLLHQAYQSVKNAAKNKGGRRLDAMPAIQEAIEIAKNGGNPEAKINHAIAMIHSGKDRAN